MDTMVKIGEAGAAAGVGPTRAATWTALAGLAVCGLPGLCPACWPGLAGVLPSLGVAAIPPLFRSTPVFVAVVVIGLVPLVLPLVRERQWEALAAALTGVALIVEALWLGGHLRLHLFGVFILVSAALVANRSASRTAPPLTQIRGR